MRKWIGWQQVSPRPERAGRQRRRPRTKALQAEQAVKRAAWSVGDERAAPAGAAVVAVAAAVTAALRTLQPARAAVAAEPQFGTKTAEETEKMGEEAEGLLASPVVQEEHKTEHAPAPAAGPAHAHAPVLPPGRGHVRLPPLDELLEAHAPDQLICPITLSLLDDPVLLFAGGCTYSRAAIEQYLAHCRHGA